MHITVSWDISAAGGEIASITERLISVFKPYSWIRPLSNFYVIKLTDAAQRERIHAELLTAARSSPNTVLFLVSPVIEGSRYEGLLPKDAWQDLNAITR